jgi:AraC-like DNA-binding protein
MSFLPSRPARLPREPEPARRSPRAAAPLSQTEIRRFLDQIEPGAHIEQLISCLPDTNYFAKNRAGQFVLMDEGFIAMLGCKRKEDILGKTDFDFFPKDLAKKYVSDDRRVMTSGEPLRDLIEPVPDDDLTFSWWAVNKVPLRDRAGNVIGLAGITSKLAMHSAPSQYGEAMFGVLQYIGEHYRRRLNMAELASQAGLSVRSLERNFLKTFNTTPLRYINRVRLQAVRHSLIHTNKPLSSISDECGFYDQSHMTAQFTRHFGMSPRKYRAANHPSGG